MHCGKKPCVAATSTLFCKMTGLLGYPRHSPDRASAPRAHGGAAVGKSEPHPYGLDPLMSTKTKQSSCLYACHKDHVLNT